jgi:apolipoprotein N-acyltransferase
MWKMIDYLKRFLIVKLFVIYLRYLIGFAFIFASIIKIKGERFTSIPPTEPVGHFFEAMYRSGFYWNFLGWAQLIAGSLLMSQRFSTIGALVFFPIILNVCLITISIDFGSGTPVITTLMLLGTVFLILLGLQKIRNPIQTRSSDKDGSYQSS